LGKQILVPNDNITFFQMNYYPHWDEKIKYGKFTHEISNSYVVLAVKCGVRTD